MDSRSKEKNIYLRKDGRWEGRYVQGRKTNGRLKYGYVYGKSYLEVKSKLIPLQQASERMLRLYGKGLIRYDEWIHLWKENIQDTIKISTFSDYNYKLKKYILPYLGELPLYQITGVLIQNLIDDLKEKSLSPTSIHLISRLLSKTLKRAQDEGLIDKNPCEGIILPKRVPKKVHALTIEQQRLLTKVAESYPDLRGQAIIIALNTGMRIGELAALSWKNVDFRHSIINVEQTCHRLYEDNLEKSYLHYDSVKSLASNRVIPMNQNVKSSLKKIRQESKGEYVFAIGDKGCEPRTLTYHFHRIRKLANLNQIHFHQLRHTFATRCIEAKVGIPSISALLGHSSAKMTLDIYSDSMIEERSDAVIAIEKMVNL